MRKAHCIHFTTLLTGAAVAALARTGFADRQPRPGEKAGCDGRLIDRLLGVLEAEVIPLTREGVRAGNKIFGAAMLRKSDLSTIITGTNNETENPLWHGEIHTIKQYYEMVNQDETTRVAPEDVIFVSTHEPCTLCLSAIAWSGFDNFYYLFSHEDSRDSFNIGHDLRILKEVFRHEPGGYSRENDYWTAYRILDLIHNCEPATRDPFLVRIEQIKQAYAEMSRIYQANKRDAKNIPLK